jgi:hypothetical protein
VVVPVDDPAVEAVDRVEDALREDLRRRLGPVRAVVEGVEFDMRQAEALGDRAARRRLPRAGDAGDAEAIGDGSKLARGRTNVSP